MQGCLSRLRAGLCHPWPVPGPAMGCVPPGGPAGLVAGASALSPFPCVGVDGRGHPDLLLLRHLSRVPDRPGQLQRVPQQLLQVMGAGQGVRTWTRITTAPQLARSGVLWRVPGRGSACPHPSAPHFPVPLGYQVLGGANCSRSGWGVGGGVDCFLGMADCGWLGSLIQGWWAPWGQQARGVMDGIVWRSLSLACFSHFPSKC